MYKKTIKIVFVILTSILLWCNFSLINLVDAEDDTQVLETTELQTGDKQQDSGDDNALESPALLQPDFQMMKGPGSGKFDVCKVTSLEPLLQENLRINGNDWNYTFRNYPFSYKGKCIEAEPETVTIIANKIVCDDELYLPNWGTGGDDIDENTVDEFLATDDNSSHCYLIEDWSFQWGVDVTNPGDDFIWEADGGWTTFMGSTEVDVDDISKIWVREVLEDGYIPFTYLANSSTNVDDVSAEMYCYTDVANYDNYDSISINEETESYNCVAFNVEEPRLVDINAQKIVCDDESYLPNWAFGEGEITDTTVADFLETDDNSEHCDIVEDWDFQWGIDVTNPGNDFIGESGSGWTTFMGSTQVELEDDLVDTIWVREVLEEGFIPFSGTNDDFSAEMYCSTDVANYDNHDRVLLEDEVDSYNCVAFNVEIPTVEFVAQKIVCDDESYLPNWGAGGDDITSTTAEEFLATDDNADYCELVDDWKFQWGYEAVSNPGNDFYGEASDGWNTFVGSAIIPSHNVGSRVEIREVLEDGYIPFTKGLSTEVDDVSAEMYCHTDVSGYDNEEWVSFDGSEVYNCIGFNYREPLLPEAYPVCEDGKKYAKIILDEVEGLVPSDNTIWFGNSIAPVGVWFELPTDEDTSHHSEGIVFTYGNDTLNLDLLKFADNARQDFAGTIEFAGLEFDGDVVTSGFEPSDVFVKDSNKIIYFDLATTTGDDSGSVGLKESVELCQATVLPEAYPVCEDGKRYAKLVLDEFEGILPEDSDIWFGDSIAPVGVWFELPTDEQTSSHTEGIVFTYGSDILNLDVFKLGDNSWQEISGSIEFFGAELDGDVSTNLLETSGTHIDVFTKELNNVVRFDFATTTGDDNGSMTLKDNIESCAPPMLEEIEPTCEDGKRYAKLTINEASGGLDTDDDVVWFGDKTVPLGAWFELPTDAETSSHVEGAAVLTYDNNILTVDLLHRENNEKQHFSGMIEFYGARIKGDIVEGRVLDNFYKLERNDSSSKESYKKVIFDFQDTTANDEISMKLKDNVEFCNDPFKIISYKIVCEDESELPDHFYGLDVDEIKSNTAKNWVKNHESCSFVEGWDFQYGFNDTEAPAGDFVGESTVGDWTTFGSTNVNGKAVFSTRDLEDVSRIKVREVLQDDYIPFTDKDDTSEIEYTAEIYCGTDIAHYDNVEYIEGDDLGYGETVYCIAWNAPKGPDPLTMCQNDFSVNNDKDLSIIDLDTGNQTYVNDLEFGSSASGVDPMTGNVYYIERTNANPRLAFYNITDHTNTVIGHTGVSKWFTKMAFDNDGVLYAMTEFKNSHLYTIDITTGVATHIDATPSINKDGGDLVFDDNGDLYVLVKGGKLFRVVVTSNSTLATFVGYVQYDNKNIETTGLVFKNGLFYVTDNDNSLYSFSLNDLSDVTKISENTNDIHDLASCPVNIQDPIVGGDGDGDGDDDDVNQPVVVNTEGTGGISYKSANPNGEEASEEEEEEEEEANKEEDNIEEEIESGGGSTGTETDVYAKERKLINNFLENLNKEKKDKKQRIILQVFGQVKNIEQNAQGNADLLDLLNDFKIGLANSYID